MSNFISVKNQMFNFEKVITFYVYEDKIYISMVGETKYVIPFDTQEEAEGTFKHICANVG